jgi:hypothetical protein
MWCNHTVLGLPRVHSGEKYGMPFQISTNPSQGPLRRNPSLTAVRRKTA